MQLLAIKNLIYFYRRLRYVQKTIKKSEFIINAEDILDFYNWYEEHKDFLNYKSCRVDEEYDLESITFRKIGPIGDFCLNLRVADRDLSWNMISVHYQIDTKAVELYEVNTIKHSEFVRKNTSWTRYEHLDVDSFANTILIKAIAFFLEKYASVFREEYTDDQTFPIYIFERHGRF